MFRRNPFNFFTELFRQQIWVPIWVMLLMVVNVTSIAFWGEPLARLIFFIFMISAILMMALYSQFGFEKILGMGHFLWIPLLLYGLPTLSSADGLFQGYLIIWSLFTLISLAFDIRDVWKYFKRRLSL